ncbi:electron transport complex subunit RsxG [Marinospirillum insulare]|uniref:Ion-translocating oxidoreductase complex subunit G n=1 Tax=Marinospirillum insulare TaxID=217169 RepID=A0ABQ5ZZB3_9GAMM|nr:electron transport complex subunit RsxG [Marinospirillum insulare]GLR64347.1 electron transport complex subunit RsxG [Marinospirillum insulare]
MTDSSPNPNSAPSYKSSLTQSVIGLVIFAVITAGVVSFTRLMTAERIHKNQALAEAKVLYSLAPTDQYELNLDQPLTLPAAPELGHNQPFTAHLATQKGQPALIILPLTAKDGYTGDINLLVAMNLQGEIKGVSVVSHRETPGLGDRIEERKSDWLKQFAGKSLTNPTISDWAVKKDGGEFDQFTGATITPRAVVNVIKRSLLWQQNQAWQEEIPLGLEAEVGAEE